MEDHHFLTINACNHKMIPLPSLFIIIYIGHGVSYTSDFVTYYRPMSVLPTHKKTKAKTAANSARLERNPDLAQSQVRFHLFLL